MSADNVIYIKEEKGKWYCWCQSASCEPLKDKNCEPFDTQSDAIHHAFELEDDYGYIEYGIQILD